MTIPKSIVDAFGGRWNPNLGHIGDSDLLAANVRAVVSELQIAQSMLRVFTSMQGRKEETPPPQPPPPPREAVRISELPAPLAKSPAIVELHKAAEGGIVWPAHPGRPLLSNVVARLQGVACDDKADFARKLGTVIAARRRLKIWPCREGQPLDAMGVFFNDKIWSALSSAAAQAGQVRKEVSK